MVVKKSKKCSVFLLLLLLLLLLFIYYFILKTLHLSSKKVKRMQSPEPICQRSTICL